MKDGKQLKVHLKFIIGPKKEKGGSKNSKCNMILLIRSRDQKKYIYIYIMS